MAQKTDLNINPYYDDFDAAKNYHRILFKPGFAVQARELTQSQLEDINKSLKSEPPISKSKYLLQFINYWINNADKKSVIQESDRDKINDDITDIINELIKFLYGKIILQISVI